MLNILEQTRTYFTLHIRHKNLRLNAGFYQSKLPDLAGYEKNSQQRELEKSQMSDHNKAGMETMRVLETGEKNG